MGSSESLEAWLSRLIAVPPERIELGLARVEAVYQRLGNVRPAPIVLTVAGTNGKGSTVAFLVAMLRAAGYRVGSYTSPHLFRFNERIVIDGVEASDSEIIDAFRAIDSARGDIALTFFDFAGSIVVHAVGGWIALPAVILLGARSNRYRKDGAVSAHPPSNIPFLALGAWVLTVGWFGFNVMSAQTLDKISGLVAVNSLMAMVGGTLAALIAGKNDPGFVHNGPLAGLVAVCAGSDLMHPLGALVVGAVAGTLFVVMFTLTQNKWKIDDVLGVWPLHGLCGAWGGVAAGIFGAKAFGGLGGVSFGAQFLGTAMGVIWALLSGFVVYGALKATLGLRLSQEEEYDGADMTIHKISATPDREVSW